MVGAAVRMMHQAIALVAYSGSSLGYHCDEIVHEA